MKSLAFAVLSLACAAARAAAPGAPDLPLRTSPWLEEAKDSKTCPLVDVWVDGTGTVGSGRRVATVWLAREDAAADPSAWPALYLSVAGRSLALRREGAAGDIESQTLRERRGAAMRWSAPAERVFARLQLQAPRLYAERADGWRLVPPAEAVRARQDEESTRTVWKGRLRLDLRGQAWEREVEVVSTCAP
ncbi:hypothetical protein A7A76_05325 [Lysobacter enzymogenes]|uniref:hypothetical protein n=1 Tax=Lysobacter enzymogenes TaxID=69 RepID=UPI0019D137CA|nr:hypothetical protein [Lysobacter enzymogenes]MBN7138536.1 hypothetical protein [Lysobacter enzymogenes]